MDGVWCKLCPNEDAPGSAAQGATKAWRAQRTRGRFAALSHLDLTSSWVVRGCLQATVVEPTESGKGFTFHPYKYTLCGTQPLPL